MCTIEMCHVCHESYPGIKVVKVSDGSICQRCKNERGSHHFSKWNNMDPGDQPKVLKVLTQVEEMLIAQVNPISQVTHAHGGQYIYIVGILFASRKMYRWSEKHCHTVLKIFTPSS